MRNRILSAMLALSMILFLSGCWQDSLPEEEADAALPPSEDLIPVEEHSILPEQFCLPYDPEQSLDPVSCPDGMQQVVGSLLYEGLFHLDQAFEPQPLLCASFSCSEDARSYTFTLRPDIRFSDGSPLTGKDVKATWSRAKSAPRYAARLAGISRISAEEDSVTVTLSSPDRGFPALLDIPIVKAGSENDAVPLGTGPYYFDFWEGFPHLLSNPDWWQGTSRPVDRMALVEASDRDSMLYRFTSHEVQLITTDLTNGISLSVTGNISFRDADTRVLQYLGCNVSKAPLDNSAFRAALWQGFNRSTIISAFLSGHGKAAQFPVSPVSPLYPVDLEEHYSREGFLQALEKADYQGGRSLKLLVNEENPFKVSVAEYLAASFRDGGVPIELRVLPWEEFEAALLAGNFDLYLGEARLPANWELRPLLGSGGALNLGGWADEQSDVLLAGLASDSDRTAAMKALCRYLKVQAPILPICFKSSSVLMQADVLEGLKPTDTEPFYGLSDCSIHLKPEATAES